MVLQTAESWFAVFAAQQAMLGGRALSGHLSGESPWSSLEMGDSGSRSNASNPPQQWQELGLSGDTLLTSDLPRNLFPTHPRGVLFPGALCL